MHELAKSAWQIHVKAEMRSSWWEEKDTFGSVASLLPFVPDAEAAARFFHSDGSASVPSDPIRLCCVLCHPVTPTAFSGDRIQKDQLAASGAGMGNLPIFAAPCSELSRITKTSVFLSFPPQPSDCSISSLFLLGEAHVPM